MRKADAVISPIRGWHLAKLGRTLYARATSRGSAYELVCSTDNLVALMDLAAESKSDGGLNCDTLILCLDKADPALAQALHALLYVGGVIVTRAACDERAHDQAEFVLVGLDL